MKDLKIKANELDANMLYLLYVVIKYVIICFLLENISLLSCNELLLRHNYTVTKYSIVC